MTVFKSSSLASIITWSQKSRTFFTASAILHERPSPIEGILPLCRHVAFVVVKVTDSFRVEQQRAVCQVVGVTGAITHLGSEDVSKGTEPIVKFQFIAALQNFPKRSEIFQLGLEGFLGDWIR
jgi:hypothetical protein